MESICLTQKQMEVLSDVKHATVSEHIKNILTSGELNGASVGFSDKSLNGSNKKSSGKSREFKLLLKMVERGKHSPKSSDCLRPPSHPSSHPPRLGSKTGGTNRILWYAT